MAKGFPATHNPIENDGKENFRLSPTAEKLIRRTDTYSIYRSAVNLAGKKDYQYLPTSSEIWCKTIMEIYEDMYHKVTDMAEILAILSFRSAVMGPSIDEDERPRADTKKSIEELISLGYELEHKLYWDKRSAELVDRAHSKAVFESCYESWLRERISADKKTDNTREDILGGEIPLDAEVPTEQQAPIDPEAVIEPEAPKDTEAPTELQAPIESEAPIVPETFLRRELPTDFYEYVAKTIWSAILRDGAAKEKKVESGSSPFEDWL